MLLLAIDTSTPAVSVALHDGTDVLAESTSVDGRRHGELLAPGIEAVLASAGAGPRDLTDVAVGIGPGPFTGLRVGIVTARVMSAALDLPLHGVCSLDALAAAAQIGEEFLVATDARRKEVYWARYAAPLVRVGDAAVERPAEVAAANAGVPVVGPGAELYRDVFGDVRGPVMLSAGMLAAVAVGRLDDGVPMGSTEPLYLRRPDATPPVPRAPASAP